MNIQKRNKHLKKISSEGGKARAKALSAKRRKEISKKGLIIRWERYRIDK